MLLAYTHFISLTDSQLAVVMAQILQKMQSNAETFTMQKISVSNILHRQFTVDFKMFLTSVRYTEIRRSLSFCELIT